MAVTDYPARKYLSPSKTSLWQWNDDGMVVTFNAGGLIVFRAELQQVLDTLSREGLPPLASVLMLLAACRDGWRDQPKRFGILTRTMINSASDDELRWLRSLCWKLDAVSELPEELRSTTAAKIALATAVFEQIRNRTTRDVADEVVRLLDGTSTELFELRSGVLEPYPLTWWEELRPLSQGLESVDFKRLGDFEKTGLDRLPEAAPIDVPEFETVRDLLSALENDEEFAGLVRLARHVMASVSLPRAVSEPEEIPIGGVSDISNRGPFDRLLISELAHDSDVLMSRVALNEALYLRRESPPRTPPNSRVIVLDCGIRMWGIPRVFATAVGLALAATAEPQIDVRLFCAAGPKLEPVSLRTREDLVEHLAVLRHDAHPGRSLPALQRTLAEAGLTDAILVTSPDVMLDADFRAAMRIEEFPELHVATVSRQGEFRLDVHRTRGSKRLAGQLLSIDEILEGPRTKQDGARPRTIPIERNDLDPNLPAIFFADPFPLRLSHPFKHGATWELRHGDVASVTRDRRLMLWDESGLCARQLMDDLPRGDLLLRSGNAIFPLVAVFRDGIRVTVVLSEASSSAEDVADSLRTLELPNTRRRLLGAALWQSKLFLISKAAVGIFDLHTGEPEPSMRLPSDAYWRFGRFFTIRNDLHALSHDGAMPMLSAVFDEAHRVSCVAGFDCPFANGPVGVTVGGAFIASDGKTLLSVREMPVAPPIRILDSSWDGVRVLVESPGDQRKAVVNLESAQVGGFVPRFLAAGQSKARVTFLNEESSRSRIRAFRISEHRNLAFSNRRGDWFEIRWNASGTALVTHPVRTPVLVTSHFSGTQFVHTTGDDQTQVCLGEVFGDLKACRLRPDSGIRLKVCESVGGSRIFVDSRGLVHLKSAHADVPEITLVLSHDGRVAGWTNAGLLVGPHCFTGLNKDTADGNNQAREYALLKKCISRFLDHIYERPEVP